MMSQRAPQSRPRRGGWMIRLIVLTLLLAGGLAGWHALNSPHGGAQQATAAAAAAIEGQEWRVQRGPLSVTLLAPGEVKARASTTIVCQIEGEGKIIWIVPEGTIVNKGDKLVELEVSELQENLVKQRISVATAEADFFQKQGELEIQVSQNRTDLLMAQNKLDLANLDLEKYKEGDYPQKLREIESDIKLKQAELQRAEDRLDGTRKLLEKGYVNKGELEADQLSLTKAKIELEKSQSDKDLLEQFEKKRQLSELQTAVVEASEELARTRVKSESERKNKSSEVDSAKSKLELEQLQLTNLNEQLKNTKLFAPQAGMVVYSNDSGRWNQNQRIEEGALVRNRQKLIELPDFSSWMVETRVHESMIQQVAQGQQALISLEALGGQIARGSVAKIGVLPDSSRWFMPDTKEYLVNVDLSTTSLPLKPGMSAKTELLLKDLRNVLTVPIQAISGRGGKTFVMVKGETGPAEREVQVGLNNDRFAEIKSGLEEGSIVLLREGATTGNLSVIQRPSDRQADSEDATEGNKDGEKAKQGAESAKAEPKAEHVDPRETAAAVEEAVKAADDDGERKPTAEHAREVQPEENREHASHEQAEPQDDTHKDETTAPEKSSNADDEREQKPADEEGKRDDVKQETQDQPREETPVEADETPKVKAEAPTATPTIES